MSTPEQVHEVREILAACKTALANRHPALQGAALAELVALWLAGHRYLDGSDATPIRENLLELHVAAVRRQLPIADAELAAELTRKARPH